MISLQEIQFFKKMHQSFSNYPEIRIKTKAKKELPCIRLKSSTSLPADSLIFHHPPLYEVSCNIPHRRQQSQAFE